MDTTRLIIGIVSYLLGILTGIIIKSLIGNKITPKNDKWIVLLVVTSVWAASMIMELINPTYHTNPMVHGLMGSIVGFFYKFEAKPKEDVK